MRPSATDARAVTTHRRIIVAIKPDRAEPESLALGVTLSRALDAPLLLAAAYVSVVGPGGYAYQEASRQEVLAGLAHVRAGVPDEVTCDIRAVCGITVVQALHQLAEHTEASMIVLGPTHRGAAVRLVRGDVTHDLLHDAPCAVAVAPEGFTASATGQPPCVGVAYVPTPEGRAALHEGAAIAARLAGTLRVLFAGPVTEASERMLAEARRDAGTAISIETVLLDGVDAATLLRVASEDLDLLMMGSRGHGPMRRVLLGSVSSEVVHRAACPVIVLPRGARVAVGA